MPRGKKTSEEKREAVKAVLEMNPSASSREIARIVDMPDRTVREVMPDIMKEDEFAHYRQIEKKKAIQKAWTIVTVYMDHLMQPEVIEKAGARDSIIVAGTSIDKAQLLSNEPTQITESRESTPELIGEMEEKLSKLKAIIGKKTG